MRILIDANVLLRVAQTTIASHATSLAALTQLANADYDLCVVPQSIYEYWVVAMQRHGLTNLLTFNKPDFSRFVGIHVLSPENILASQLPT